MGRSDDETVGRQATGLFHDQPSVERFTQLLHLGRKNKKFQHDPMEGIEDLKSADEDHETIMWLTEEEFEDLLIRMRKIPVNSRGVDPEEKYRRDRAVVYLLTYAGLRRKNTKKSHQKGLNF